MRLVQTYNLVFLRKKYIEVIEQTPDFMRNVRWIYGQHPKDEMIQDYMDNGEMYTFTNGNGWPFVNPPFGRTQTPMLFVGPVRFMNA